MPSESFFSVSQKLLQEAGDYAGYASQIIMCMKKREVCLSNYFEYLFENITEIS